MLRCLPLLKQQQNQRPNSGGLAVLLSKSQVSLIKQQMPPVDVSTLAASP